MSFSKKTAFTLIELLTVIAIIGILAAILFPALGAAKTATNKAKTRSMFAQWSTSMGLFKNEYGYYPIIGTGNKIDTTKFAGALTGRKMDGTKYLTNNDANLCGNSKMLSFYSLSTSDLDTATQTSIVDAFGNTDIAFLVDSDGNGVISGTSPEALVAVAPLGSTVTATPALPTGGIRASVVFYSAGKGGETSAEVLSNIITSW